MASRDTNKIGPLVYIDAESYEAGIKDLWFRVFAGLYETHAGTSKLHLEKSPVHALWLNEITRLFPEARIIFLTRDSRAVVSSLVHAGRSWGGYWAPKTYKEAAILWYLYMRAVKEWRSAHPDHPFLEIRYEDAVDNPTHTVRRVLSFLEVDDRAGIAEQMIERSQEAEAGRKDPEGFARRRGPTGWRRDMPLHAKLVTWRYTRKMMRAMGYECHPLR